ncbi:hypothetical protein KFE25_004637 [Diacronema lutheri]|uniref:SS18 N-terminal domain-containing protein n=1 Tax=Diacronema lutheri TaxID=2081491 RepID=A0A8J5XBZ2_DIALT|nr:hypothetical protein KFE25_004637 [Diacronema lutheri]
MAAAGRLTAQGVDEYLEENAALLRAATAAQHKGNVRAALTYSLRLQQNLLFLGIHADRFGDPRPPRAAGDARPGAAGAAGAARPLPEPVLAAAADASAPPQGPAVPGVCG